MVMIKLSYLQEIRKTFSTHDIPLMNALISRMYQEKPHVGLRIIYNAHMTISSLLQIEALAASGAELITTAADHLCCDPKVIDVLSKANIPFVPYSQLKPMDCDVVIDCCAGLLDYTSPRLGAIELTQTGVVRYAQANTAYPVISVDDTELKKIETLFGTADGFVRGLHKLSKMSLRSKKYVLFGYGKVGHGIARTLAKLTPHIIIIEHEYGPMLSATRDGFKAYLISQMQDIHPHLLDADCIITATGVKNALSDYFERCDIGAPYLVNMGSEDEFGDKFSLHDVLNDKLAVNFCLEYPTRVLFLDPVFYAQIRAIEPLLEKNLPKGISTLPKATDLEILSKWILNHYHLDLEGDYFSNIIKHIPSYIYWKDTHHIYQGCNEQFAKSAGLSDPKEIIGKSDYELAWGKTDAETYINSDNEAMFNAPVINIEETQLQANGERLTVLANKVPFHDEEGHVLGVLGIYSDITDRKKMEEDLNIAKEKAEAANYIMTEFISNMGHDLATPISDVGSIAQMLDYHSDQYPELKELLQMLITRSTACEEVRKRIINATSLSNLEVKSEKFSTLSVLLELEKAFRPVIDQKNLKLIILPIKPMKEDYIETDQEKFHAILEELLSNAINFTEAGSITISVSKQNDSFTIQVTDTGIGIPADKYDYIFEQYTKLSRSNKHGGTFKGVGAGLYLARVRANILGATIHVKSKLGKGSIFTLSILSHPPKDS